MVVIVIIKDPAGPSQRPAKKRVSFVSYVKIKPIFLYAQVEPGETIATTKEGKYIHTIIIT